MEKQTEKLIIKHCEKYPHLQIRDLFKFLFQSSFGCEHLASSLEFVTDYIRKESEDAPIDESVLTDALDGKYTRIHLSYLKKGLSVETFGKIFFDSFRKETDGREKLEEKIKVLLELAEKKAIPFDKDELISAFSVWKEEGYPPVHHSERFRSEYHPAYRVVKNEYVPFLPLFAKLDTMLEKGRVVLAIEGGSASGKSTLSKLLDTVYDCNIFHMDDFFLQVHQRTEERFLEVGGNVDRERFFDEVVKGIVKGTKVSYRRFDCSTQTLSDVVEAEPKRLTVVEGVYSTHPFFGEYYNLSAFLDISPEFQKKRINVRNSPAHAQRFFNEWIPLEERYFSEMKIKEKCDIVIKISE